MRPRVLFAAAAVTVLGVVGLAAPSHAGNGVCKIDLPKLATGTYQANATKDDYAPGKDKLKVT